MNEAGLPRAARRIGVELGRRSYEVLIGQGLLAAATELIEERLGAARSAIVTDTIVAKHHLDPLEASLKRRGRHVTTAIVPAGEASKSFAELAALCERLLEAGLERSDLVIALGGGVVGDLAGFAASILRRGVGCVQIPTTLLAQVDASVGGKTGINTAQGKNLVGSFHQPSLVLADTGVLGSLPAREFRAGYAEIAKFALLGDRDFFAWLETNAHAVLARESDALLTAITTSVKGKAELVARDETEASERMLLNLGHTFAHALETATGFGGCLLHGEAVAVGIVLAFRLSAELGFASETCAARAAAHLGAAGLPTTLAEVERPDRRLDPATLLTIMRQDKKVRQGKMTLILARGLGEAFVARDVPPDRLLAFLSRELGRGTG
jgi:shikimate kinase/3-dehydroquinate synthase